MDANKQPTQKEKEENCTKENSAERQTTTEKEPSKIVKKKKGEPKSKSSDTILEKLEEESIELPEINHLSEEDSSTTQTDNDSVSVTTEPSNTKAASAVKTDCATATTDDDMDDFEDEAEEEAEETFDKNEYIYQKLVKKRNRVYSCIANVLKNYNRKQVLDAFIPEREKLAMNLAATLMTKDGYSPSDFGTISADSSNSQDLYTTNEIITLSAINFLINQVHILSKAGHGELEFSKEAKDHLTELAIDWAKLRDQAFMFSNGMIKLEYELHDEFHFVETELYHETEKKLKSIGVVNQSSAKSKLQEMRDQRRKMSDRTINDLNDLVQSWHSEIAYLRRITEFYASMRQLTEEEVEAFSILFENFGSLMILKDLRRPFKLIPIRLLQELREKRGKEQFDPVDEMRLMIYESLQKFELGKEDVPYFLCRRLKKDGEEYLQIPIISLLLFSRFCNSYSETTRSKKAHDLELIVSEIASLSGWEVVDQNVEIISEGDTVTEIDIIIKRNKTFIVIEVKDLALWRGWYFDRESLIKRYEIFTTAAQKLKERRLLLKKPSAKLLIVTALTERWKKVDGIPIVPLKALNKYLRKLKRLDKRRRKRR
jgi:Holliday junction resolvase-like predicted endonuclease